VSIYYTTLAEACAVTGTAKAAPSMTALAVREVEDLTETTISTMISYTATMCLSTGLINCPASLRTTLKNSVTSTLITSVPFGSDVMFPAMTTSAVSTIPFGTLKQTIAATTGSPVSYVPPTTKSAGHSGSATGIATLVEAKIKGNNNKVIIGVCVGLVLPLLVAIIAGYVFYLRRKRYTPVQKTEPNHFAQPGVEPPEMRSPVSYISGKKSPNVAVFEIPRKPVPVSY
jgi:hypothetical protein